MAFNPTTGLVYFPIAAASSFSFTATPKFEIIPGVQTLGLRGFGERGTAPPMNNPPAYGPVRPGQFGVLSAWIRQRRKNDGLFQAAATVEAELSRRQETLCSRSHQPAD